MDTKMQDNNYNWGFILNLDSHLRATDLWQDSRYFMNNEVTVIEAESDSSIVVTGFNYKLGGADWTLISESVLSEISWPFMHNWWVT